MEYSDITFDQPLDTDLKERKVYLLRAVWIGTLLGGPLVAGYMMAYNFKTLHQERKAIYTWIITSAITLILFFVITSLPESDTQRFRIVPFIDGGIAYLLVQLLQLKQLNEYIINGGKAFNVWTSVLAGIIIAVVTLVIFVILSFFV